MYTICDGWVEQARIIQSPNFNERPETSLINAIIIHSISLPPGSYQGNDISDFFMNHLDCHKDPYYKKIADLKVSSHILIRRTGELIQYVNLFSRAWHAGQSSLYGQDNCNNFSIGIELEGTDNSTFEQAQYTVLTDIVLALMACFPKITSERIVGHSDIAPGRKTDPGSGFDWQQWKSQLTSKKLLKRS